MSETEAPSPEQIKSWWIESIAKLAGAMEECFGDKNFNFFFVDGNNNRISVDISSEPSNLLMFPTKGAANKK